MSGYGLTVFHGSRIDTFEVRVLGVQRNVRAAGSIILAELSGHDLELTAIPRGMSGSPVFLEGRFAGAVAFGWAGALKPIVGLTPAEEILALPGERESLSSAQPGAESRQASGPDRAAAGLPASLSALLDPAGRGRLLARKLFGSAAVGGSETMASGGDARVAGQACSATGGTVQWAGAFDGGARGSWPDPALLAARLLPGLTENNATISQGLFPLPASLLYLPLGGGARLPVSTNETIATTTPLTSADSRAGGLRPGAACAVALVMGDAQMGALGTTTWVNGERVYLMGHPLMQQGAVTLPLASAEILGVFPSRQFSFKFGSFGQVVGAVHHDLRAGLTGRLGAAPQLVPVEVEIFRPGADPQREHYSFSVVQDPRLSPSLVFWCLYSAMLVHGDDLSLQTIHYDIQTTWRREHHSEQEPVVLSGAVAGPGGAASLAPEWMAPLQILMANRHEPLELCAVKASLTVSRPMAVASIAAVQAPEYLRPGQPLPVGVTLRPRLGDPVQIQSRLEVPPHLAPGRYRLLVASARDVFALESERAAGRFTDRSLAATLALIRSPRAASQLAIMLYSPSRGVVVEGRELADLPASVGTLLRSDHSGQVSPTAAGVVLADRHDCQQVLQGHVVRDLVLLPPKAPTKEEARP